jgi:hypothetical protein
MLRSFMSFMAVTTLAPFALGESAMARPPLRRTEKIVVRDPVRVPYLAGKVYEVRLMPGVPFAIELPTGEAARNIWVDNRWWRAKSTQGSSRVFLRRRRPPGIIHIEKEPSDSKRVSHRLCWWTAQGSAVPS